MSSRSNFYNQSDDLGREVQRKLAYMRADVPPRGSLNSSFRAKSSEDNAVSPNKIQSIHELFLNNDKYQYLKESFNKSPTSSQTKKSASTYSYDTTRDNYSSPTSSSQHQDHQHFQSFKTDSHSHQQRAAQQLLNHSTTAEAVNSNSPNFRNVKHDMASHPLVQELAERGLTMSCKKRKLQTAVRKEVETKLILQS